MEEACEGKACGTGTDDGDLRGRGHGVVVVVVETVVPRLTVLLLVQGLKLLPLRWRMILLDRVTGGAWFGRCDSKQEL